MVLEVVAAVLAVAIVVLVVVIAAVVSTSDVRCACVHVCAWCGCTCVFGDGIGWVECNSIHSEVTLILTTVQVAFWLGWWVGVVG